MLFQASGRGGHGGHALEPLEESVLEVVQPPFVLDDPEDPRERFPFFTCQEEDDRGVRALRLHARSVGQLARGMGIRAVNAA